MDIYALLTEMPYCLIVHYKLTRHGENLYWKRHFFKGDIAENLVKCLSELGWWDKGGPTVEKVKIAAERIGAAYLGEIEYPPPFSILCKEGDI